MMRREFVREPSFAANWSVPPAVVSLALGFVATFAHRTGLLASQNFVLVAAVVVFFALAGSLLSLLGFYSLWNSAAKGGRRSAWAFFLSLPVLAISLLAIALATVTAPLSDISTDRFDPPRFTITHDVSNGENINEPPRINPQVQFDFYPQLTGRRYALSADTILTHVSAQMVYNGWRMVDTKARAVGGGDWLIEATAKTTLFGFVDSVILRITDEGTATYVDMRSASNFGLNDLGSNARRIENFMKDLDLRVSLQVK
ncbi:MAG: DUF1499 domain-containing protein [Rhizobiaceae bacterium]